MANAPDTLSSPGSYEPQLPLSKSASRASISPTIHTREVGRVESSAATDNIFTGPASSAVGTAASTFLKPHIPESTNWMGVKRGISLPKTLPQKSEYSCNSVYLPSKRTLNSTTRGATKRACLTNQSRKASPVPSLYSSTLNGVNTPPSTIAPTKPLSNANTPESLADSPPALKRLAVSRNPISSDVDVVSPSSRGKLNINSEAAPSNLKVESSGVSHPKLNNDILQKSPCGPSIGTKSTQGKANGQSRRTRTPGLTGLRWTEDEVQALLSCVMSPCRAPSWTVVSERMNKKGFSRTSHGCHQHFHMLRACGRVPEGDGVSNMRHLTRNPGKKSTISPKTTPPIGKVTFKPVQPDSGRSNVKTKTEKLSNGPHVPATSGTIIERNLDCSSFIGGTRRKKSGRSAAGEISNFVTDNVDPSVREFPHGNNIFEGNNFNTSMAPITATTICDFDLAKKGTHDDTSEMLLATSKTNFMTNKQRATSLGFGNEQRRGIRGKDNTPRLVRWTEKEMEALLVLVATPTNSRTWKDVSECMTKAGFPNRSPLAYSVQYSRLRQKEGTAKHICGLPCHDSETKCFRSKGSAIPNVRHDGSANEPPSPILPVSSPTPATKSGSIAVCNDGSNRAKCAELWGTETFKRKHVSMSGPSLSDSVDSRLNLNTGKIALKGLGLQRNGFFHYSNIDSACSIENSIPSLSGNVTKILRCIEFSVKSSLASRLNRHIDVEAQFRTRCPKDVSRFTKVSGISLNLDLEFEAYQGSCNVVQQRKAPENPQFMLQFSPRPMSTDNINTSTDFLESVDKSRSPEHQNNLFQSIELVDCTKTCADAHSFDSFERRDNVRSTMRTDMPHLQVEGAQTLDCMDEASWMKKLSASYGVENPIQPRALGYGSKATKDRISALQSPLVEVAVPNTFDPINELTDLLEGDRDNNQNMLSVRAGAMIEADIEANVNGLSLNENSTQVKLGLFGASRDRHRPTLSIPYGLTTERRRLGKLPQVALEYPSEGKLFSNLICSGPASFDVCVPTTCVAQRANMNITLETDHPQSGNASSVPNSSSVSAALSLKHLDDIGAITHAQSTDVDNEDIEFTFTCATNLFPQKGPSQKVTEDGEQSTLFKEKKSHPKDFTANPRANTRVAAANTGITSIIDQLLDGVFCRASSMNSVKNHCRKRQQPSSHPNQSRDVDVVRHTCKPGLANYQAGTERLNAKSVIGENGISRTGLLNMHLQSKFKYIPVCDKADATTLLETDPKTRAPSFKFARLTTAGTMLHPGERLKEGMTWPALGNTVEANTKTRSFVTSKRVFRHTHTADSVLVGSGHEKNPDSFKSERLSGRVLKGGKVCRSTDGEGNAENGFANCPSTGESFQNEKHVESHLMPDRSTPSSLHTVLPPPTACHTCNDKSRSICSSHETCSQKAELSGLRWKDPRCALNDTRIATSSSDGNSSAITAQSNDKLHSGYTKLLTQRDPLQHATCVDANTHSDAMRSIPHAAASTCKTFSGKGRNSNKLRAEKQVASVTLDKKHCGKDSIAKSAHNEKGGKRGGCGKSFSKPTAYKTCDAIHTTDDDIPLAQLARNRTLKNSEQDIERAASFGNPGDFGLLSESGKQDSRNADPLRPHCHGSAIMNNNVVTRVNQGATLPSMKPSTPTLTSPVAQLIPSSYGNRSGNVRRGYATPRGHVEQDVRDMILRRDDDEEESTSGDVGGSTDSEYAFLHDPRFWGPLNGDGDSDISDVVDDGRPLGELFF